MLQGLAKRPASGLAHDCASTRHENERVADCLGGAALEQPV
jgi:hypothetical protein